jgi:CheY-like chemotaxis protein
MPPTNPRIIIVDDSQGIYNIVRASLELLGRRPRLIETHSGDDALAELRVSSPDLLITAHSLAGRSDGPVLANMAKRELAALPIIVLADERDPEIDEETLAQSPFQYLRRPFLPETFMRALRVALDGPEAVPTAAPPEDIMGPVPVIDSDRLRPILFKLMRDVAAMAVILADRNGKVITYEGAAGYVDRDLLAAALGPGFGNTAKILSIIGDQPRILKYFDGDKLDLFSLGLGLHYFIMLIFETNAGDRALGNVKRFGGSAVNEMLGMIGEVAFSTRLGAVAAPAQPPARASEHGGRRRRTQETAAVPPASAKAASAPAKPAPSRGEKPAAGQAGNFDLSLLDQLENLDLSQADELFDPDKLEASGAAGEQSGNKISFDDALLQGIIGNVDDQ